MLVVLFAQYVKWHFIEAPLAIIEGVKNILWFNLNYFSVPLLFVTLFAPWRGLTWQRQRAFTPGDFLFTLASNLISRIIGAIVRIPIIIAGIVGEIVILLLGIALLLFWLLLPALIPVGFFYGFILLF